jgi:hypothetical protein
MSDTPMVTGPMPQGSLKRPSRRPASTGPGWRWVTGFGILATLAFLLAGFTGWRWPALVGLLACGCVQAALAYSFQNRGR